MVSDNAAVAEAEALSVTFTVKLADPAVLAVPDIVPASERLRPAGSDPLAIDQLYGGEPPDAPSVWE
jgi:hypothetical protein